MAASEVPSIGAPTSSAANGHADHFHRANGQENKPKRVTSRVDWTPSKRYILPKKRSYAAQYSHVYFCRLRQLRSHVEKTARATFGPASPTLRYVKSIVDASDEDNVIMKQTEKDSNNGENAIKKENEEEKEKNKMETVMIGIIFREMKGKPSILAMYDQPSAHSLIPDPPPRASTPFGSSDDKTFLEDDNVRCALDLSNLSSDIASTLITGVVVAVRGREDRSTGAFSVSAVTSVGLDCNNTASSSNNGEDDSQKKSLSSLSPTDGKAMVCMVSSPVGPTAELLLEELRGTMDFGIDMDDVESTSNNEFNPKQVSQMIIAGNIVTKPPPAPPGGTAVSPDIKERLARSLRDADAWLSAVAATLPVACMPGCFDAANALLPQQPLHRCLLPSASRSANLQRVPNPCAFRIDGKLFVGTSGQNVSDLSMHNCGGNNDIVNGDSKDTQEDNNDDNDSGYRANGEKVLDILELLLMNRHLAPTCPDTLGGFPFTELDPFVMEETPDVFFAGNQKEFATRLISVQSKQVTRDDMDIDSGSPPMERVVRIISIPRFDETGQAIFVDLNSLDVSIREFGLIA